MEVWRSERLLQRHRSVEEANILIIFSWVLNLALNQNAGLGLKSIGRESPLKVTRSHWVILALQSHVVRRHFGSQRSRKQNPVISDSEWRLVPLLPSSWETSLVWCYDRASLESVPPTNSISTLPQSRVLIPRHSASNKTGSSQVSGSLVKNYAESELFDYQAPKVVTSHVSKRGWNNDDDNLPCIIQERRAKVVCSLWKLRKIIMFQSWLISIKKSYS